jgi:hypothetical protein
MALPKFNFQPIVAPFTPLATKEFGETVNVLNQNYDSALENFTKSEQALAALQAAGYKGDQEEMQRIKEEYNSLIANAHSKGDYENQLSASKKLASKLGTQIIPLAQRKQDYDNLVQNINSNNQIKDKRKAHAAIIAEEELNPTLQKINGQTVNIFDPARYNYINTSEPNVSEIITRYASMVKSSKTGGLGQLRDIKNSNKDIVYQTLASKTTETLTAKEIEDAVKLLIEGDNDLQAYKQKSARYGELGKLTGNEKELYDDYDIRLNTAITGAGLAFQINNTDWSEQSLGKIDNSSSGGGGDKITEGLAVVGNGRGYKVTQEGLGRVDTKINEINSRLKQITKGKKKEEIWDKLTPQERNEFLELDKQKAEFKKVNEGVLKQVDSQIDIDGFWKNYNQVYDIFNKDSFKFLEKDKTIPNLPKTKKEFVKALHDGNFNRGVFDRILDIMIHNYPSNAILNDLKTQSQKYRDVYVDVVKNYEYATNISPIASSDTGEAATSIGRINKLLTENIGKAFTFSHYLTKENLDNSNYINDVYGDEEKKNNVLITANFTENGQWILQLDVNDKDGNNLGAEPIVMDSSDETARLVQESVDDLIRTGKQSNIDLAKTIIANYSYTPSIKKHLNTNKGVAQSVEQLLTIAKPFNHPDPDIQNMGLKIGTINENGQLKLGLIDENNQYIGSVNTEEDLAMSIYKTVNKTK